MEEKEKCTCDDNCSCGCQEGKECTCNDDKCHCEENQCACNDELKKSEKHKHKKNDHKLDEANLKIKELEDKLLREKAETINYNRRREEEMSKRLKYCNEDIVKDILPVVDNLERAINMETEDPELKKFLDGVKMIYCNLLTTLEKYEVKLIDGNNKPFDPTYHQALLLEHVDNMESNMVVEVLQKGYLLKDKVIRPAMVKVSE